MKLKDLSDEKLKFFKIDRRERKLSYENLNKFFLTLHTYIKSGVPLIDAIDLLSKNKKNGDFLKDISENIKKGYSVSLSMENTEVFPPMALFMIRTGEQSGKLEHSLERLASYYENLERIKNHVRNISIYPMILILSVILLLIYINFYFLPSLSDIFSEENIKLNAFSSFIMNFSKNLNNYTFESLIIFFSSIFLFFISISAYLSENQKVNCIINTPLIGDIFLNNIWLNLFFSFSLMLDSGVDLITSSKIIRDYTYNNYIKERIKNFSEKLSQGNSITETLENMKLKDENILYFISLGERTGNIKENIDTLKNIYIEKSEKDYKKLISIIQPLLILIITVILAFTMFAILIPMLDYASNL